MTLTLTFYGVPGIYSTYSTYFWCGTCAWLELIETVGTVHLQDFKKLSCDPIQHLGRSQQDIYTHLGDGWLPGHYPRLHYLQSDQRLTNNFRFWYVSSVCWFLDKCIQEGEKWLCCTIAAPPPGVPSLHGRAPPPYSTPLTDSLLQTWQGGG